VRFWWFLFFLFVFLWRNFEFFFTFVANNLYFLDFFSFEILYFLAFFDCFCIYFFSISSFSVILRSKSFIFLSKSSFFLHFSPKILNLSSLTAQNHPFFAQNPSNSLVFPPFFTIYPQNPQFYIKTTNCGSTKTPNCIQNPLF
jgi:hypothetical protein